MALILGLLYFFRKQQGSEVTQLEIQKTEPINHENITVDYRDICETYIKNSKKNVIQNETSTQVDIQNITAGENINIEINNNEIQYTINLQHINDNFLIHATTNISNKFVNDIKSYIENQKYSKILANTKQVKNNSFLSSIVDVLFSDMAENEVDSDLDVRDFLDKENNTDKNNKFDKIFNDLTTKCISNLATIKNTNDFKTKILAITNIQVINLKAFSDVNINVNIIRENKILVRALIDTNIVGKFFTELSTDQSFSIDEKLKTITEINHEINKEIVINHEKITDLASPAIFSLVAISSIYCISKLFNSGTKKSKLDENVTIRIKDLFEDKDFLSINEESLEQSLKDKLINERKNDLDNNMYKNLPEKIKKILNSLNKISPIKSNHISLPVKIYNKIKPAKKIKTAKKFNSQSQINETKIAPILKNGNILITDSLFNLEKFY
jgi:hypothetical protein